jgi:hypothetical protein
MSLVGLRRSFVSTTLSLCLKPRFSAVTSLTIWTRRSRKLKKSTKMNWPLLLLRVPRVLRGLRAWPLARRMEGSARVVLLSRDRTVAVCRRLLGGCQFPNHSWSTEKYSIRSVWMEKSRSSPVVRADSDARWRSRWARPAPTSRSPIARELRDNGCGDR